MNQDFAVIIEIKNPQIASQLKKLEASSTIGSVEIGKFDPLTNRLELKGCLPMTVSPFVERFKRSVFFLKTKNGCRETGIRNTKVSDIRLEDGFNGSVPSEKQKKTQVFGKGEVFYDKIPKASISLKDHADHIYTDKKEKEEIKDILLQMFTERKEMNFDEIQRELDQPRGHLQAILNEICEKRKERNKFVFYLKDIFMFPEDDDLKKNKKTKRD